MKATESWFEKHVLVHLNELYQVTLRLTRQAADAEDIGRHRPLGTRGGAPFENFSKARYPGERRATFNLSRACGPRRVQADVCPNRAHFRPTWANSGAFGRTTI